MGTLYLIRHAQASFGAADYDVLSDTGHAQSHALGKALARQGVRADAMFIGAQRRHRETLEGILAGMGAQAQPQVHPGLNEFDFKALLDARFRDASAPDNLHGDRKTHFRTLRDTVLAWQRDEVPDPPETWAQFTARVEDARRAMAQQDGDVIAVSSGGAIGQMLAAALAAPPEQQIRLQLQMKNCAVNRFVHSPRNFYLHGFNETPHIDASNTDTLLTYS
jgi:broad specificity phosphatase PhoE